VKAKDIARDAIDLFLEYRDVHGYNEKDAKDRATFECDEGEYYRELDNPPEQRPESLD